MSEKEKIPPHDRFKFNLIKFIMFFEDMFKEAKEENIIHEKISLFPLLKIAVKNAEASQIVKWFIEQTYDYWDKIYEKDQEYVEEISSKLFNMVQEGKLDSIKKNEKLKGAKNVLEKFSKSHIDNFKAVITGSYEDEEGDLVYIFDEQTKSDFWDYLQIFVKISINHIHSSRGLKENGKYKNKYFPEINISELNKKWKVNFI